MCTYEPWLRSKHSEICFNGGNYLKLQFLTCACLVWSPEPFVWTMEPTKEELTQKLNIATRSMEHMNSLLHETEATNAALMEQIAVCIYKCTHRSTESANWSVYSHIKF